VVDDTEKKVSELTSQIAELRVGSAAPPQCQCTTSACERAARGRFRCVCALAQQVKSRARKPLASGGELPVDVKALILGEEPEEITEPRCTRRSRSPSCWMKLRTCWSGTSRRGGSICASSDSAIPRLDEERKGSGPGGARVEDDDPRSKLDRKMVLRTFFKNLESNVLDGTMDMIKGTFGKACLAPTLFNAFNKATKQGRHAARVCPRERRGEDAREHGDDSGLKRSDPGRYIHHHLRSRTNCALAIQCELKIRAARRGSRVQLRT
jgi:hypothetical protein